MTPFAALAIAFATFWLLSYLGASLIIWTLATALFVAGISVSGLISVDTLNVVLLFLLPLALLFNFAFIRRNLITRIIFSVFKKVLPDMTSTEREALEAGDVWWEAEMFRGKPDWPKLLNFKRTELTEKEQSFLDNEVETLCSMIDDWKIHHEDHDLSPELWAYIRENGFMSMLISKEWGGLGFSAYAQSCVVTKIATRSIAVSVTVMVPNSLGPGELLMHYGTDEQKQEWLPGLAAGKEIPCFGLTGPEAGSDAGAIPDTGIVCMGEWNGQQTLGMRVSFSKRYITLSPVATVVGLALKVFDPDGLLGDTNKSDYGITCALIPADLPGVDIGRRHSPCGTPFMNGPIFATDVFVPIDFVIGGREKVGKGWRMLVECLSAGRGISLPALASAAGKSTYLTTGAYTRIRRQFKMSVGKFEGVQEAMGRMAGLTYKLEACRSLTASAVDNCSPSVVTAMMKYHMTEMMRTILTDAMDIHGGRGVMQGPRNYLASAYQAVPIAITVEGANILTRNLMIYGQGSIRCHPYVFPEMEAARKNDLEEFDQLLWGHIGFSINRGVRAVTLGLTGARLAASPVKGPVAKYYRQLTRLSSALAFVSDVTMGVLGGELKRKERLSARLGDVLSHLFIASAVLKYYHDEGEQSGDLAHAEWAVQHSLNEIGKAFDEFFVNFPNPIIGRFLRFMTFPLGSSFRVPTDKLTQELAELMMEPTELKNRLCREVYTNEDPNDQVGRIVVAYKKLLEIEPLFNKFSRAVAKGLAAGHSLDQQLDACIHTGILTKSEADQVAEYDKLRIEAILTDDFTKEYLVHPQSVNTDQIQSPAQVA